MGLKSEIWLSSLIEIEFLSGPKSKEFDSHRSCAAFCEGEYLDWKRIGTIHLNGLMEAYWDFVYLNVYLTSVFVEIHAW